MSKRHFLMLAQDYQPHMNLSGWYASEKLDGQRAYWDGGITRGLPKSDVPWANTEKDGRYRAKPVATGLWSRYGNVIHAPDWWLDQLPKMPLDGELWVRRDYPRQALRSVTSALEPDFGWQGIKYYVFDTPPYQAIFYWGTIDIPNMHVSIGLGTFDWAIARAMAGNVSWTDETASLNERFQILSALEGMSEVVVPHAQIKLPSDWTQAGEVVEKLLAEVTDGGGEGLIIRAPQSLWVPHRTWDMVKIKKLDDMEGTVIGYTSGYGKYEGMMGALVLRLDGGQRLELSGFTDAERALTGAIPPPGMICGDDVENPMFPRGSQVTFRYRGKSRDGVPQEARYWRKYDD